MNNFEGAAAAMREKYAGTKAHRPAPVGTRAEALRRLHARMRAGMCNCGTCARCIGRARSQASRRLSAPLDKCPVWQRLAREYDARFPYRIRGMFDLLIQAERGAASHTAPKTTAAS